MAGFENHREFIAKGASNGVAAAAVSTIQEPLGHVFADPNLQAPARPAVVDCSAVTNKLVHKASNGWWVYPMGL